MLISYLVPKYKKVSFSNPGHAINLAKKLNKQFSTDKFTVVLLDKGKQIYPKMRSKDQYTIAFKENDPNNHKLDFKEAYVIWWQNPKKRWWI